MALLVDDDVIFSGNPSKFFPRTNRHADGGGAKKLHVEEDNKPFVTTNCEMPSFNKRCSYFEYGRFDLDRFMGGQGDTYRKLDTYLDAQLGVVGGTSYLAYHMWNFGVTTYHMQACR